MRLFLSLSLFPSRAGGLLTAGRQRQGIRAAVEGETGASVLQVQPVGCFASVRLSAHSQLEPHCCLAHSAGGECQLPPSLPRKYSNLIINLQKRLALFFHPPPFNIAIL